MNTFTLAGGKLSALVYVQVTRQHTCIGCGASLTLTIEWPEGLTQEGEINMTNPCPECKTPVRIPKGRHYVEGFKLLTEPTSN